MTVMSMYDPTKEYFPVNMDQTLTSDTWVSFQVPRVEPFYEINPEGRIRNSHTGKELTLQQINKQMYVALRYAGKKSSASARVDRLVLTAFGPPTSGDATEPVHLDEDGRNCHIDNLRWGTPAEAAASTKNTPSKPKNSMQRRSRVNKKPPVSKPSGTGAPARDEVEVFRVYRSQDISVTVDSNGNIELPTTNLDSRQASALAKIMARISELNAVMGR